MPDEMSILGTAHIQQAKGNWFQRASGRGGSSTISAKLNFDIPGLKDFKTQLDAITKSLDTMNTSFSKLAKAPEAFSKSLESVVKQMKVLQAAQVQANRYVNTGGTPPQQSPVGQASAAAAAAGGGGGGAAGAFQKGASGGMAEKITKGIEAMMARFDAGMQKAISGDVYASRMAMYAAPGNPNTGSRIFARQGDKGFGFMATDMVQGNQVQYQGTGIGAYMGAAGRPGQNFNAYATSIKQMQEVLPGLDATQGASQQSAIFNNVQGIKLARMMLGPGASPYNAKGERKTQNEYFKDILTALQKLPRPNGQTGNWTKDDIMKMNFPGSRLNAWLSAVLPEETIPVWFDWAIANAMVGGTGLSNDPNVAKKQLEKAGRGRSLATNAQETQNREAQKDAKFGAEQYGAMNARLDYEKQMLGMLEHIDSWLAKIYGLFGRVPSLLQGPVAGGLGAMLGGGIGMLGSLFGGDPGYMPMGDAEKGTSHLTPDLRKRVNSMMAANPNIKMSSAYRDTRRQQSLQGKGPFAPAGKSEHGKGRAADLGPSSQMGWIAKNARKFGLDSATQYGEPWHVQLAGTLGIGDPATDARQQEGMQGSILIGKMMTNWAAAQSSTPSSSTGAGGGTSAPGTGDYSPGENGKLSADQMVQLLHDAGFQGEDIVKMAGISRRESGWNPGVYNGDESTGDNSYGLWQINVLGKLAAARLPMIKAAGGSTIEDLKNPLIAAKVAHQMWESSGYTPWGPYKGVSELHNVKQEWLDEALAAAEAHGFLGDPGYAAPTGGGGGSGGPVTLSGGTTIVFQNTFQLAFPNGANRQSIDVAARQIASRLEPLVRRSVPRNN